MPGPRTAAPDALDRIAPGFQLRPDVLHPVIFKVQKTRSPETPNSDSENNLLKLLNT